MNLITESIKTRKSATWTFQDSISAIKHEMVRKSLHVCIAFVPGIASLIGVVPTMALLVSGILVYTLSEALRLQGKIVPVISHITVLAMRERDKGTFVLGPVTLAIGAMLSLSLYPEPAAAAGIYVLAFGDGIASLAGKAFGSTKIPFTGGKSVEGSLACFLAVYLTLPMLLPGTPSSAAFTIATAATLLEALPSKDFDNILLPFGAGAVAMYCFM